MNDPAPERGRRARRAPIVLGVLGGATLLAFLGAGLLWRDRIEARRAVAAWREETSRVIASERIDLETLATLRIHDLLGSMRPRDGDGWQRAVARESAIWRLTPPGEHLETAPRPEVRAELRALLGTDDEPVIRTLAGFYLIVLEPDPESVEALVRAAEDDRSKVVRLQLLRAMSVTGHAEGARVAAGLLDDGDAEARRAALLALRRFGRASIEPILATLAAQADDPANPTARAQRIDVATDLEIEFLTDPNVEPLPGLEAAVGDALIPIVRDRGETDRTRASAALALQLFDVRRAIEALKAIRDEPNIAERRELHDAATRAVKSLEAGGQDQTR